MTWKQNSWTFRVRLLFSTILVQITFFAQDSRCRFFIKISHTLTQFGSPWRTLLITCYLEELSRNSHSLLTVDSLRTSLHFHGAESSIFSQDEDVLLRETWQKTLYRFFDAIIPGVSKFDFGYQESKGYVRSTKTQEHHFHWEIPEFDFNLWQVSSALLRIFSWDDLIKRKALP
jgi:hypothetical protein